MFPCHVAGCGRMLRSSVGESWHFNASHCRDFPPVYSKAVPGNTRCFGTYNLARTTTTSCWGIKMRPHLKQLALLMDMSGQLEQLKPPHRMSFSTFPGRSLVGTVVVVPVEVSHLPRQSVRAKLTAGMAVSDGGGSGAGGTVILEHAVLYKKSDILWTRLARILVQQRRAPRVTTLRRELVGFG